MCTQPSIIILPDLLWRSSIIIDFDIVDKAIKKSCLARSTRLSPSNINI